MRQTCSLRMHVRNRTWSGGIVDACCTRTHNYAHDYLGLALRLCRKIISNRRWRSWFWSSADCGLYGTHFFCKRLLIWGHIINSYQAQYLYEQNGSRWNAVTRECVAHIKAKLELGTVRNICFAFPVLINSSYLDWTNPLFCDNLMVTRNI